MAATPHSSFGFCFCLSLGLTFVLWIMLLSKWCTPQQNLWQGKARGFKVPPSFPLLLGTNLQTPLNASGKASGEFWPIVFFPAPWFMLMMFIWDHRYQDCVFSWAGKAVDAIRNQIEVIVSTARQIFISHRSCRKSQRSSLQWMPLGYTQCDHRLFLKKFLFLSKKHVKFGQQKKLVYQPKVFILRVTLISLSV